MYFFVSCKRCESTVAIDVNKTCMLFGSFNINHLFKFIICTKCKNCVGRNDYCICGSCDRGIKEKCLDIVSFADDISDAPNIDAPIKVYDYTENGVFKDDVNQMADNLEPFRLLIYKNFLRSETWCTCKKPKVEYITKFFPNSSTT